METKNNLLSKLTGGLPSSIRLRDLIRQIRACKTAADERAVVQKECAYIRSTFREEDNTWRCRNVAKLLYIHMLGYPAHFGQLECLKLIASPRFIDKRVGYLGATLLLDERQDVHLLITNSLKNDLTSQTQFVAGLALSALGSICSPEMSRDLAGEVEKLVKSSNVYLKKKAALCAFRIIKRVPEILEMFIPAARSLLTEKNHGVLVAGVILVTELCSMCSDTLLYFKKLVPNLVRILKNLVMAGYSPDHDVNGINDPFLQVKILRLLRVLGKQDDEASEIMNDILAQVATNTETSKNVGNAILYETVLSIMGIKSESGLRVLGVNILGRFLLNIDKNIRYVALNTLLQTVNVDNGAVQRHRNTVLDCLKDPDVSIQRRAMELCFALINSNNIRTVTKDLLSFIESAGPESKAICSSKLFVAAEVHAPTKRWHIDTMIKVLTLAGNYVPEDLVGNLIQLISESSQLHVYTTQQLWKNLGNELASFQPLVQVATWCIGEFGDLLNSAEGVDAEPLNVAEEHIFGLYEKILYNHHMTLLTKEYTINSLMKLSVRFPKSISKVKNMVDVFGSNMNIELQQRAVEFSSVFSKHDYLRPSIFERMPAIERKNLNEVDVQNGLVTEEEDFGDTSITKLVKAKDEGNALLDLLGAPQETQLNLQENSQHAVVNSGGSNLLDLLGGLELNHSPEAQPPLSFPTSEESNIIMDGHLSHQQDKKAGIPPLRVFEKNGLKLDFTFERPSDNLQMTVMTMLAKNETSDPLCDFLFQAAVPKTLQLQLLPPSGNVIPANNDGCVTQVIKVLNPTKTPLRMRIKLSYTTLGMTVEEQSEIKNFPSAAWQ
ncbi:AP-1 complex subunit gamma-1-like isoform X3 [Limulus polyphemus]|uniref:AP-1 complex subunit gamma n=1 Tax=Limulus polyphemus TaxID=6850 RepID=A0ABM1SYH4_LIMPO|nr:AP-1 complex subunit gamma-1-like isoform X3 [Limulus polyphemus]